MSYARSTQNNLFSFLFFLFCCCCSIHFELISTPEPHVLVSHVRHFALLTTLQSETYSSKGQQRRKMLKRKEDRQPKLGYTRAQCWPNVCHCVNVIQDTRLACGRVCTQSGRSIPFSPYRVNRFTFCIRCDMMLGCMCNTGLP